MRYTGAAAFTRLTKIWRDIVTKIQDYDRFTGRAIFFPGGPIGAQTDSYYVYMGANPAHLALRDVSPPVSPLM